MIHIAVTKADKPCSAVCAEQLHAVHSIQVAMQASLAERSFSSLRDLKSTVTAQHLTVLHIHKDSTDTIDLHAASCEFVMANDTRNSLFGTI